MSPNLPDEDALALPPGHIVNHYQITRVIGKGGFGITYAAQDIHTGSELAIKELLPTAIATRHHDLSVSAHSQSLHDDFRWAIDSFIKEARTLAKFKHPHLVRMLEFFEQNGTAYMVMPYIQGDDIKGHVAAYGTFTEGQCLNILISLCDAVNTIHQAGILHRDIKPENIILEQSKQMPILLDFGASRNLVALKSQAITSIISPGYAPIEQYSTEAKYQGPWSDVYALASVAYFMLTGTPPPEAPDRNNALRHGKKDPCIPLLQLRKASPTLSNAIAHAMQMSERQRPQNARIWQDELRHIAAQIGPRAAKQQTNHQQTNHQQTTAPLKPNPNKAKPPVPHQPDRRSPSTVRQTTRHRKQKPVVLLSGIIFLLIGLITLGTYLGVKHYQQQNKNQTAKQTNTLKSETNHQTKTSESKQQQNQQDSTDNKNDLKPVSHSDIRQFVLDYYNDGKTGQQLKYYADYVNYFGKPSYPRNAIDTDSRNYNQRWPERNYTPGTNIHIDRASSHLYHTQTALQYEVSNGVESRTGKVLSKLSIGTKHNKPVISAINNEVLEEASVRYNAEAQKKDIVEFITRFIKAGNSDRGSILKQLDYYDKQVSPYYKIESATQDYIKKDLLKYAGKYNQRSYQITEAIRVKGAGRNTLTAFAVLHYRTRNTNSGKAYSGNLFNTYQITYHRGQPVITGVSSEPIE
ncbi:serine/threonine protein kinase [Verrucomicrobiaceae bacterium N1E253]|uniref:Serine/threonine protein kinase n=1 Tax=Oceaniferula marina TaxID=2748318 RepID=A0A851G9H6_9BACT|nr:serine/threonine-protein kinase [Oceaniferula marina]NWK54076.1 serine/threonine protein kinase [Oceaniferula marina]